MNTAGKVMVGVLAGAAVGLLTGILLAPDSGKKTREKLIGKSKDLRNKVTDSLDDVKMAYNRKVDVFADQSKSRVESIKNGLKV
ncbi:MAG: YtxH domain-containing protein [Flammeovirgaceae bacterium]|jgi:gas vesicle protein|nr:YtxH domain-containing protein [Flammeovirgaceae bacterium]